MTDEQNQGAEAVATEEMDEAAKLKEAIDVQTEDVSPLRKKVIVTIPRETIDERKDEQFSELKRDAMVPGFRKGRAPMKLIEKRFGSEVGEQMVSQLVGNSFLAAMEKVDLKTVGDPLIWVSVPDTDSGGKSEDAGKIDKLVSVEEALPLMELPEQGAMTYACEVEVHPEFGLPELDGIAVQKPQVTISDGDIEAEIDRMRSSRGQYVPVEKGKIKEDDLIVGDLTMLVDGKVVKEEKNVSLAARPQLIEGTAVEGLGDALVGHAPGETVEVQAEIGDDHEVLDYRGKKAVFQILINDVKRLLLPELNDSFLQTLGFDSRKELEDFIKQSMEARLASTIRRGMRGQIQKYLLERTKLEVPDRLSQRQTERLVDRRMVDLFRSGVPSQEIEKQIDKLRATAQEEAISELKLYFVMEKIAETMDVQVTDTEVNGAIAGIAQQQNMRFDRVRDRLSKGGGLDALYLQIRDDKILDSLLDQAKVTEVEGPKKTAKPKAEAVVTKKPKAVATPKPKAAATKKVIAKKVAKPKKPAAKKAGPKSTAGKSSKRTTKSKATAKKKKKRS